MEDFESGQRKKQTNYNKIVNKNLIALISFYLNSEFSQVKSSGKKYLEVRICCQ